MPKYIVTAQPAHWTGPGNYVVVQAAFESEAEELASQYFDQYYTELYSAEYDEQPELLDEDSPTTIVSVEEFTEAHDLWKFFKEDTEECPHI